jgi:hypothetical protein
MRGTGYLAAGTAPFNIAGLQSLLGSAVGLLVIAAGASILLKVHGQRTFGAAVTSGVIMLFGLAVVGLSLGNQVDTVARDLAGLVFHP